MRRERGSRSMACYHGNETSAGSAVLNRQALPTLARSKKKKVDLQEADDCSLTTLPGWISPEEDYFLPAVMCVIAIAKDVAQFQLEDRPFRIRSRGTS